MISGELLNLLEQVCNPGRNIACHLTMEWEGLSDQKAWKSLRNEKKNSTVYSTKDQTEIVFFFVLLELNHTIIFKLVLNLQ